MCLSCCFQQKTRAQRPHHTASSANVDDFLVWVWLEGFEEEILGALCLGFGLRCKGRRQEQAGPAGRKPSP